MNKVEINEQYLESLEGIDPETTKQIMEVLSDDIDAKEGFRVKSNSISMDNFSFEETLK